MTTNIKLLLLLYCLSLTSCTSGKKMEKFEWMPTECAPELYPVEIYKGHLVYEDGNSIYVPSKAFVTNGWGEVGSMHIVGENLKPVPVRLNLTWLSFTEDKFFTGSFRLPQEKIAKLFREGYYDASRKRNGNYNGIVVGMAPGGRVAVWVQGIVTQQVEVGWFQAHDTVVAMKDYAPSAGNTSQHEFVDGMMKTEPKITENLKEHGYNYGLWDSYRERFSWRPVIEYRSGGHTDYMDISYYNGEKEELALETLAKNDFAERPRMKEFDAYWNGLDGRPYGLIIIFEEAEVFAAFKKLHDSAPEKKIELFLRLDPEHQPLVEIFLRNGTETLPLKHSKIRIYDNV